jgi:hypothetical protein
MMERKLMIRMPQQTVNARTGLTSFSAVTYAAQSVDMLEQKGATNGEG